jgi:SAM-dependent methyltransferase
MDVQAEFRVRDRCITCDSRNLATLDHGGFGREPHLSMLRDSPWGQSPLPFLHDGAWELVACRDCGTAFHRKVLTESWDNRRFAEWMTEEAIAAFEARHGGHSPAHRLDGARHDIDRLLCIEKLTRPVRGAEPLRLLDFGCGWGRFVAFAELFGFDAHGIDRSSARRARSLSPDRIFPSLDDYRAQVGKPAHAATLFEVLEHLYDPAAVVRAVHAELVPGGILVAEVPNCAKLRRLRTPADLALADGLDHINAFSPRSLQGLVERAGFERVRPPTAQLSADWARVVKREIRRVVDRFRPPGTQQFFRRA